MKLKTYKKMLALMEKIANKFDIDMEKDFAEAKDILKEVEQLEHRIESLDK